MMPRRPLAGPGHRRPGGTARHEERLDDLLVGYGADVDREVIRAWWSSRRRTGHGAIASTVDESISSRTARCYIEGVMTILPWT